MIELEIQTLSETREGLLIDVGGIIVTAGFTLLRQRLAQDPHGALLTMVVRGPSRKQRALEDALDALERIISFEVSPFVQGEMRPHFAASRKFAHPPVAPLATVAEAETPAEAAPAKVVPATAAVTDPTDVFAIPSVVATRREPVVEAEPEQIPEAEPELDFILPNPPAPAPAYVEPEPFVEPFVELVPTGPDESAVEAALPRLLGRYPQIFPALLALEKTVSATAREQSLWLAGKRLGRWVFKRDYAALGKLELHEAIERIGAPALGALVEIEHRGEQLHIRQSPLCTEDGHAGCQFFNGYLEGLLGPAVAAEAISVFTLCCRSCGADECVLAISD